jgi:Uma2 family endonuclease
MAVPNPHIRFRYEDYKTLPESMLARYELLDGALLMVPAPTPLHQRISRNLEFLLLRFVREHALGEVFDAPVDVVLGTGNEREVVQPDLLFVEKTQRHLITAAEIQGAPALVVEVTSPGTEARDRGYKKVLYGRYGVREYWIVDPQAQTVEVYVLGEEGWQPVREFARTETLTSSVLVGLRIELAEVFQEG